MTNEFEDNIVEEYSRETARGRMLSCNHIFEFFSDGVSKCKLCEVLQIDTK